MNEMKNQEGLTIKQQIIALLRSRGPMTARDMCQFIPSRYKTIYTEALELRAEGVLDKDDMGMWSLKPRVEHSSVSSEETLLLETAAESSDKIGTADTSSSVPLDMRSRFIKTLEGVGVMPKEAIPTIADCFFSGDIYDLSWLYHVLSHQASGYVEPRQQRLIVAWWAATQGLNYEEVDKLFHETDNNQSKEKVSDSRLKDWGLGWRIGKDKSGDWVPVPGGPLTYQEALDWAERRALLSRFRP